MPLAFIRAARNRVWLLLPCVHFVKGLSGRCARGLWVGPRKVLFDAIDEPVDMGVEVSALINIDRVAIGQPGKRLRQFRFGRHRGAIDQDWDHWYLRSSADSISIRT